MSGVCFMTEGGLTCQVFVLSGNYIIPWLYAPIHMIIYGKMSSKFLFFFQSAIHPQHGLVWANGKTINLEKISILNDQVENNIPLKLGEFE